MKVTELSVQKKNTSRFNLFIDGKFSCGISTIGVAKWGLYKGKEISESELNEIVQNELYLRFLDRAVSYLSSSFKTERKVLQYLKELHYKKRGDWFSEENDHDFEKIYEKVISQLIEVGYINDRRYAEQFILSRSNNKPRSKSILISELISKGVEQNLAKEVVTASGLEDADLLTSVYKKKYKDEKFSIEDRKKVDFLRRKGFNWDEITKLERDLKNDTGE